MADREPADRQATDRDPPGDAGGQAGSVSSRVARERVLLVPLAFSTGVALVVYIAAGVSLPLGISVAILLFATVGGYALRRMPAEQRAVTRRRVRIGLLSGVVATAAYDAVRPVWVWIEGAEGLSPFKAFEFFGIALVGERSTEVVWAAGTAFHIANGLTFAIAYCLLVRRPSVTSGVVFALALEAAMLVVYPYWLGLEGLFWEFLRMSLLGHAVYGAVLGAVARRLVARSPTQADPSRPA